jgi:hypothetical protein
MSDDPVKAELDDRLEAFFDDAPKAPAQAPSPFLTLKEIVLSMEWDLSEEMLDTFIKETAVLKNRFREEKVIFSFLQLLATVGAYIQAKQANAHPDSIQLLNSVYAALETVTSGEEMPVAEKKRLLSAEVKAFKELKEKLLKARGQAPPQKQQPSPPPPGKSEPEPSPARKDRPSPPPAAVDTGTETVQVDAALLEAIRKVIREEFERLRQEIIAMVDRTR